MSSILENIYLFTIQLTEEFVLQKNIGGAVLNQKLSHSKVTETANKVKDIFARLVKSVIKSV